MRRPRSKKMLTLLALTGTTLIPLTGAEAQTARVQLNGQPLATQVSPIQRNNRTLLPMRDIFEALGATVQWDNATQSINASQGANQIWLQIGNRWAQVNSQRVQLDQPAFLYQGFTMVPLRFVAEALGAQVSWNEALKLVSVTRADQQTPVPDTGGLPQTQVMLGTVTRDISSDQFELRGDNGQLYQVRRRAGGALPRIGERVEVRGNFDGNVFVADTVTLSTTSNPVPVVSTVDFNATVTVIQSASRIGVRTDNGTKYTVNLRSALPANLRVGDRVRVTGDATGNNTVAADNVILVQAGAPPRATVNFEGTVTEIQSTRQIIVRRDNGVAFTVTSRTALPSNLALGDRVQIAGDVTGRNLVTVNRVTRIRAANTTGTPAGLVVRLRGTVESSQARILQVRGEDGRLYTVRANDATFYARGDVIRVDGTYENNVIIATAITRVR